MSDEYIGGDFEMGNMPFDFSQGYLPNSKLQQFKDLINSENMKFREHEEDYAERKANVNRNINLGMEGLKMLKGSGTSKVDKLIKAGGIITDGPNKGMSKLVHDPRKFTSPLRFTSMKTADGKLDFWPIEKNPDWEVGKNLGATKDRLMPKSTVVDRTKAVNQPQNLTKSAVDSDKVNSIFSSETSWGSKLGQIGGTAMSGISAAKGIQNWDKLGKWQKANTVVNTLSTLGGIGGMLGLATPWTAPLAIAGMITGAGAGAEGSKGGYGDYNPYMGSVGGAATWLSQPASYSS